ncbi:MAG: DegT/DnrJ/EryC1/StrS family aminotransferase [Acidobacteria bacterium]|nr:DegT/DnrJ/EryC1/StrS family aminotransferase [Acidobacteriota bacterium]
MKIPLVDLKTQYLTIKDEIDSAIQRVIDSTSFILGEEVATFENEFAAYCGVKYALGTSSGTTAIHTALTALGIGPGDEVLTTPMTFMATTAEITHAGARPVFVDIEPRSFTLDVEKTRERTEAEYYFDDQVGYLVNRLTQRRLKAIMPVHLYGQMADMNPLLELADEYQLTLIEDAAQAHGAEYRSKERQWKRAGSFGLVACFSFYPGKNLGAYGDAGAVVTNDAERAHYMRLFIDQGRKDKYTHLFEGRNYRLDTIQAAILRVKLQYLDQWNEARRRIARAYDELLQDLADIKVPEVMDYGRHVYHLYVIRTPRRDELFRKLSENGIGAGIHYPAPLHLQPAYRYLNYKPGDFPVAEACAREVLSLPVYSELTDEQIEFIVNTIKTLFTVH